MAIRHLVFQLSILLLPLVPFAEARPHASELPWSVILNEDQPASLLKGADSVSDLRDMDRLGLRSARLAITPWSDTYWPLRYGGISWRFGDSAFPKSNDFERNLRYFSRHPKTHALSPAEKYDRLVDDVNLSLTRSAWRAGSEIKKKFGKVLDWEGLCHGWAAASFSEPEPRRAVSVRSTRGELITFTPSDIKALTTQLYAKGEMPIDFVGSKCLDNKPAVDAIGRDLDNSCLTTNPATWHLTVVNRIGIIKTSFVLDVSFNGPIWNQPVAKYRYSYFNPQTLRSVKSLAEAEVPVTLFSRDKFREHRSPGTTYVVGIKMEMTYVGENEPSTSSRPRSTKFEHVRYVYDLELDESRRILGGEWYTRDHPDFLWAPKLGSHPLSSPEAAAPSGEVWNTDRPLSDYAQLIQATQIASPKGQPIYGIVKGLLNKSSQAL